MLISPIILCLEGHESRSTEERVEDLEKAIKTEHQKDVQGAGADIEGLGFVKFHVKWREASRALGKRTRVIFSGN